MPSPHPRRRLVQPRCHHRGCRNVADPGRAGCDGVSAPDGLGEQPDTAGMASEFQMSHPQGCSRAGTLARCTAQPGRDAMIACPEEHGGRGDRGSTALKPGSAGAPPAGSLASRCRAVSMKATASIRRTFTPESRRETAFRHQREDVADFDVEIPPNESGTWPRPSGLSGGGDERAYMVVWKSPALCVRLNCRASCGRGRSSRTLRAPGHRRAPSAPTRARWRWLKMKSSTRGDAVCAQLGGWYG
jgi:hypothetical protein